MELALSQDSGRYEIVPIENPLSFEKGVFDVIRACQLLSQKNDGLILVGVAGPSGAGKSVFTEKVLNFMPSYAVINMDNYNHQRVVHGSFDDRRRLTDYDTLLDNIHGLKDGKSVQVPVYDFESSSRIGYRTLELPSSRVVILEGIYALSEKLRPLLDLRVSVTGGVHSNLVKRIFRDIQRAGHEPEELIHQIFEMVYPTYKAYIEPDLMTAHINIQNNFNPFSGFHPTHILKSMKAVTPEQMKAVLSEDIKERTEETYDIYLLPPGKDPEARQSYLRMRNRDGKYYLVFEEWVTDSPFIITPRITFEVNVHLLGGLIAMGYTTATVLKRKSHIFDDGKVIVKTVWFEQLNRTYVQVQGKDRSFVENVANQLGLKGSYVPHTYIELMQRERLVNNVTVLPDDLKTQLSLITIPRASADSRMKYHGMLDAGAPSSSATLPNQGVITQLLGQIATLNERMADLSSRMEELISMIQNRIAASGGQHTLASPMGNDNRSLLSLPSSSSQLGREYPLMEEVVRIGHQQRHIMLQVSNLVQEYVGQMSHIEGVDSDRTNSTTQNLGTSTVPVLLALAIGCLGILAYSRK